jgi:RNA polymerase sigma factor (sigma-70 family)
MSVDSEVRARFSRTALNAVTPPLVLVSDVDEVAKQLLSPPAFIGDRELLYAELQPLICRLIRRFGEDCEARRDLEGEIYYRFCLLHDAFDPNRGVPMRPYMIRQLSASVYTYARHSWRRQKKETCMDIALVDRLYTDPGDPSNDWDDKIEMDGILRFLPVMISALPDRQRRVLIWRYYDSLDFEEIATLLDIKVASARSLLRHAIAKLRVSLAVSL